jgi:hypothetical protein
MVAGHSGLIALRFWKAVTGAARFRTACQTTHSSRCSNPTWQKFTDWDDPEKIEMPELNGCSTGCWHGWQAPPVRLAHRHGLPLTARSKVVGVIFIFAITWGFSQPLTAPC